MKITREQFVELVESCVAAELENPTPLEEIEAFERENGLGPIETQEDFARFLGAAFLAANLTSREINWFRDTCARQPSTPGLPGSGRRS